MPSAPQPRTARHMMSSVLKGDRVGAGSKAEVSAKVASRRFDEAEASERRRLIEANVMHLVDLKRAEYSPRMTELVNPPDVGGGLRHFPRSSASVSLIGSPAASCAGV